MSLFRIFHTSPGSRKRIRISITRDRQVFRSRESEYWRFGRAGQDSPDDLLDQLGLQGMGRLRLSTARWNGGGSCVAGQAWLAYETKTGSRLAVRGSTPAGACATVEFSSRRNDSVMERRTFIGAVAAGMIAAPLAASAQTATTVRRIGVLAPDAQPTPAELLQEYAPLRALGWVVGRNLLVERRDANGRAELLRPFA